VQKLLLEFNLAYRQKEKGNRKICARFLHCFFEENVRLEQH